MKAKKSKTSSEDAKARKKVANKASAIRKKLKTGKDVSPADRQMLLDWDDAKNPPKVKPEPIPKTEGSSGQPVESEKIQPPQDSKTSSESSSHGDGGKSEPEAPKAGPKPPPGPIPKDAQKEDKGDKPDWQKPYRDAIGAGTREQACQQVAMIWEKVMRTMLTDIEELEGKAIIGDQVITELLRPAAVLTADKRLPKDLNIDPELMIVGSSSMMVAQRFYYGRSKKAKEAKTKKEESQALRVVAPPPKPEPDAAEKARMEENAKEEPKPKPENVVPIKPVKTAPMQPTMPVDDLDASQDVPI